MTYLLIASWLLHRYAINSPGKLFGLVWNHVVQVSWEDYLTIIFFCQLIQFKSHLAFRWQIKCIYLELRANGTFNGSSCMQGKGNTDVVLVLERLVDSRMLRICHQVICPLQLSQSLHCWNQSLVCHFLSHVEDVLLGWTLRLFWLLRFFLLFLSPWLFGCWLRGFFAIVSISYFQQWSSFTHFICVLTNWDFIWIQRFVEWLILWIRVSWTFNCCFGSFLVEVNCQFKLGQLPSDQVLLPIVLGWLSIPGLSTQVNYFDNLVNKDNDLVLQALCCVSKLSDSAHWIHNIHFFAWKSQVHSNVSLCERSSYNLWS